MSEFIEEILLGNKLNVIILITTSALVMAIYDAFLGGGGGGYKNKSNAEQAEEYFCEIRVKTKNNAIADKVTILAEKVKQIPEEQLKKSRLESYYLPELCSIIKTHSSLPINKKKDKEILAAIEMVEDVVDKILDDVQREKELTLDVNLKVLKHIAQADSADDHFFEDFGNRKNVKEPQQCPRAKKSKRHFGVKKSRSSSISKSSSDL